MGHADDPITSAWGDYDTWISRAAVREQKMVRRSLEALEEPYLYQ